MGEHRQGVDGYGGSHRAVEVESKKGEGSWGREKDWSGRSRNKFWRRMETRTNLFVRRRARL